ncbi:succinate dehydrogenase assembly factor 2 family protein [Halieaceae bacterium IMCC14734]|uniref:FAD assembly factor SdhE n=1 Tax=Candidatus Litorirhabdus singularis TaxID=2518993 RepID=A0ABT3THQ0_9GAMM|nr:succinate dehydrogenase assembly factor 2 [Candidatus Litorirhabdus singularis]MCX2981852.1 succinate dehydrogenase assembly factor 2 family protein [Candidatus Litorirhabdus singularis]
MTTDIEFNRLCWHSRRGMLELDLILEPFVQRRFRELSAADQLRYERLLECEDQDLFSWFLGRVEPEDEEIAAIVRRILEFVRSDI